MFHRLRNFCCLLLAGSLLWAGPSQATGEPLHPEPGKADSPSSAPPAWRAKLDRIAAGRDSLSSRLAEVLATLRARARTEKPELLARIDAEPPKAVATGYGLLPQLSADEAEISGTAPLERRYSIAELGDWLAREQGQAAELAARLEFRITPLERLAESYRERAENFRTLDAHLPYHSFWQGEVKKWPAFWDRKTETLALYRQWRGAAMQDADGPQAREARRKLEVEMLRITPSPVLCIKGDRSGGQVLAVPVVTDIGDEAFLAAFAEGVERFWNASPAMRDAGLRIHLTWERRSPESLYPEGPPRTGQRIDTADHRRRFGAAPLVLTTGGDSTHVLSGTVFLGTAKTSRRVLAHEFAHLLGLDDAYIRAWEGSPDDPDGVVFLEVTPFPESLLASPGTGRVTPGMVKALLDSYGSKGTVQGAEKR